MSAVRHNTPGSFGQKFTKQQSSNVTKSKSSELIDPLVTFHELVTSAFGPRGKLKMIQNAQGGHVTLTSTCGRILKVLSVSSPAVKLIISAVESHLQRCNDGGLFTAVLASGLVLSVRKMEIHPRLLGDLFSHFTKLCVDYLSSYQSSLDIGDMKSMLNVINSILVSKPGCCLVPRDRIHLSTVLLKAFLSCVKTDDTASSRSKAFSTILFMCLEGHPVDQSEHIPGLLYKIPTHHRVKGRRGPLKVAVVTISMVGDSEEFVDADYLVTSSDTGKDKDVYDNDGESGQKGGKVGDPVNTLTSALDSSLPYKSSEAVINFDKAKAPCKSSEVVITALMELARQWVESSIDIVACQKVIDSRVAQYLRQKGVVVLDRLGLQATIALLELTGATPIGSLRGWMAEFTGRLDKIETKVLGGKNYLHLYRSENGVATVILCNRQEECLEELKWACQTVIDTFQLAMATPKILPGGGAWEIAMVNHLKDHISHTHRAVSQKFCCQSAQVLQALEQFVGCFKFTSSLPSHDSPAAMTESDPPVVDLALTRINGLKTACDIARTVLQIQGLSDAATV